MNIDPMVIRVAFTAGMIALLIAHFWWRERINLLTLGIVILIFVPWSADLVERVKYGDLEIVLREYRDRVTEEHQRFQQHASQLFETKGYKPRGLYKEWESYYERWGSPYNSLANSLGLVHYWLRKMQLLEGLDLSAGEDGDTPESALKSLRSCQRCSCLKDDETYEFVREGLALIRQGLTIPGMTKDAAAPAIKYALSIVDYLDLGDSEGCP